MGHAAVDFRSRSSFLRCNSASLVAVATSKSSSNAAARTSCCCSAGAPEASSSCSIRPGAGRPVPEVDGSERGGGRDVVAGAGVGNAADSVGCPAAIDGGGCWYCCGTGRYPGCCPYWNCGGGGPCTTPCAANGGEEGPGDMTAAGGAIPGSVKCARQNGHIASCTPCAIARTLWQPGQATLTVGTGCTRRHVGQPTCNAPPMLYARFVPQEQRSMDGERKRDP